MLRAVIFVVILMIFVLYRCIKEDIVPVANVASPDGSMVIKVFEANSGGANGDSSHFATLSIDLLGKKTTIAIDSFSEHPLSQFCISWGSDEIKIIQPLKGLPNYKANEILLLSNSTIINIIYQYVQPINFLGDLINRDVTCVTHSMTNENELWRGVAVDPSKGTRLHETLHY